MKRTKGEIEAEISKAITRNGKKISLAEVPCRLNQTF